MSQQPKPWTRPLFWTSVSGIVAGIGIIVSILWPGLSLADRVKVAGAFTGIGVALGNLGSTFSFNAALALHAENHAAIASVAQAAGVEVKTP